MPALPIIAVGAAVAGAGAAVVGTVKSIEAQKKAQAFNNKQFAYEKQINQNNSVRQRRDAIRAGRLAGATVTQGAANTGGSETSAALGTIGSIASQLDNNLSFLDTQKGLADRAGEASNMAANARATANTWSQVSQLGMQVFSYADSKIGKK